jgi:hypothetical protein
MDQLYELKDAWAEALPGIKAIILTDGMTIEKAREEMTKALEG